MKQNKVTADMLLVGDRIKFAGYYYNVDQMLTSESGLTYLWLEPTKKTRGTNTTLTIEIPSRFKIQLCNTKD